MFAFLRPSPPTCLPRAHLITLALLIVVFPTTLSAQPPLVEAADRLRDAFNGPIPRALAVVVGGILFMYGEGYGKRTIAGIVFGGGLALGAASVVDWLFS